VFRVTLLLQCITAGQGFTAGFTLGNIFMWGVYRHPARNSTTGGGLALFALPFFALPALPVDKVVDNFLENCQGRATATAT